MLTFTEIKVICWRTVPTDNRSIGEVARGSEPFIRQVFVTGDDPDAESLDRKVPIKLFLFRKKTLYFGYEKVFALRKRATHTIARPGARFYICSLSTTTLVYKGQLTSEQLWMYFPDLRCPDFKTYLAMVHTRYLNTII